jgi:hypothetical protein
MKILTKSAIAILLAFVSTAVLAHGRIHFGVNIGPYWGPWWVVPPPIYYPVPVAEQEPPIVIEQTSAPQDYWYYCRPANAYYPYAKTCPEPWEKVPAKPSGQ